LLRLALGIASVLAIPAPDRPVMRATVLFALQIKARDVAENVQPVAGVASNFDLCRNGTERVDRLIQQIADNPVLGLVARGADIANRQVVVDPHMAFDESSDLPVVCGAIVPLENEDVAAAGCAAIAFPSALMVWVGQGRADGVAQDGRIASLSGSDAIGQTSFFHGASLRTA
jgi:hypothetical protein